MLHLAAMEEKTDVLKFLLEKGADPNAKDSENKIPILVAVALNNTEAVLYLAVNGTKDEVLDSCVELPARLKNATDYQEKAEERAAEFELYKVRINNAKRKAQANRKDYVLNTIKKLDMDKFVTQKEFAQKVTEILERGFSGGEIKTLDYDSCFIVLKGNKSVTQAFEGYQLYLKDVENKSNVNKIALDEMKKLIENFIKIKTEERETNINNFVKEIINSDDATLLVLMSANGQLSIVKNLVEKGVDVNTKGKNGEQPLVAAARSGNLEIVKYLVEKGADINVKNNDGFFPLLLAVIKGDLDIVKYLVEKGAGINVKDDNDGFSPLLLAVSKGDLDIVKYLVEKGADVNIDVEKGSGFTPLFKAATSGKLDIVKYLVEKGADVNVKNDRGQTLLDYALPEEVKKFLRDAGGKSGKEILSSTPSKTK
ncbi:MAG: ankyrin repeat domain-containing protein [Planctomycetaceae bacterium]|nr:ankyrin repeat domain-containing protein [Planctomycetaceae bacterium]